MRVWNSWPAANRNHSFAVRFYLIDAVDGTNLLSPEELDVEFAKFVFEPPRLCILLSTNRNKMSTGIFEPVLKFNNIRYAVYMYTAK